MQFVTVKTSHFEAELQVLKLKLQSEGIHCILHNEYTTQVMNYMPAFNVELKVDKSHFQKALSIIADFDKDAELKVVD
jgi:hypothetical protein